MLRITCEDHDSYLRHSNLASLIWAQNLVGPSFFTPFHSHILRWNPIIPTHPSPKFHGTSFKNLKPRPMKLWDWAVWDPMVHTDDTTTTLGVFPNLKSMGKSCRFFAFHKPYPNIHELALIQRFVSTELSNVTSYHKADFQNFTASYPLLLFLFWFKRPQLSLGVRRNCNSSCSWWNQWNKQRDLTRDSQICGWWNQTISLLKNSSMEHSGAKFQLKHIRIRRHGCNTATWAWNHHSSNHGSTWPILERNCWVLARKPWSYCWKSKVGQLDGSNPKNDTWLEFPHLNLLLSCQLSISSGVFQAHRSFHCSMLKMVQSKSSSIFNI